MTITMDYDVKEEVGANERLIGSFSENFENEQAAWKWVKAQQELSGKTISNIRFNKNMIAVDYTVEGKSYTLHDEFDTKELAIAALKALEKRSDIKINITQFSETIPVIFHYEIICDGEVETHQKEFQSEWTGYQWIKSQLGHPFMSFGKISVEVKK